MDPTTVAAGVGMAIGLLAWVSERLSERAWRARVEEQRARADKAERDAAAQRARADDAEARLRGAADFLTRKE